MPAVKNSKTKLSDVVRKSKVGKSRKEPLWKGPQDSGPMGGITFSALSKFLVCRERFRIEMIEGLKPGGDFVPRMEYGNMWHVCEEAFAASGNPIVSNPVVDAPWVGALAKHTQKLAAKYPHNVDQIRHWYALCKLQFPLYITHWKRHPDVVNREPIFQEQVFHVPYKLPSGRTVYLRGKWDSVDLVNDKKGSVIYVQENKSKSEIDQVAIERQLKFDLQTMMYLIALYASYPKWMAESDNPTIKKCMRGLIDMKMAGVRYNVVKRPLSGGKGTIVRGKGTKGSKCPKCKEAKVVDGVKCPKCKGVGRVDAKPPESEADFYNRVRQYIVDEPEVYFARFKVDVSKEDVAKFERTCLWPILESLCNWYEMIESSFKDGWEDDAFANGHTGLHYRHPFGVYNVLNEGGSTDLDEYLENGSEVGLRRVERLFEELETDE